MIKRYLYTITLIFNLITFFVLPTPANASTITVANNGAGSNNSITVTNTSFFNYLQTNFSNIFNSVFSNTNTGNNNNTGNTNGNNKIKTGNANSNINITTTDPTNVISVPEFGILQGFLAGSFSLLGFFILKKRFV